MMSPIPIERVHALAEDVHFIAAVEALYAALDARIAVRSPCCINRGLCCKFTTYGHKLFVTPVELAYFIARTRERPLVETVPGCCPHQADGRCTVREARPIGCRIFFCDQASQSWQPPETEATLNEIKALHARFDLPYAYVEWLDALRLVMDPP